MPRKPFSLKAYLALNRDRTGAVPADFLRAERPAGRLLWAHGDSLSRLRALVSVCQRIRQQRPELSVLVTGPDTLVDPGMIRDDLPGENVPEINAFLDHWAPDHCLWASHALRPALLHLASERGCGLTLIDADDREWTTPSARWLPDLAPATLGQFDSILATDESSERRLRRMGVSPENLTLAGPLTEAAVPPDCPIRQHEEMAALLVGRPLWLAARLHPDEVDVILRAHGRASRLAHRLLLFVVPDNPADQAVIAAQVDAAGFRVCHWDAGEMPDENTQIILASGPEELGLWYRLAPLAFIGGSLVPGRQGHDPLEAAALGSAILYGPAVGRHLASYSRLAEAGAARIVKDVDTLSAAVSQLIAPDRAAAMAHAGWDIISAGAAMTDQVVDLVLDRLDRMEAT
ncbi:3-deoxy-D-manno-octulosonic acid transferase [Puniceibacterium sediminis]|uniref:3-deoxy-D-manno-octulosonic acid transferase n=1 Tax=Puniceibacterium sediminis TaxID=1608407 RepID=A0A238VEY3_9RHOB|nr:glycosyltransferase N-terminal domain-containing protein [Puniceibacterium sediminis]SNR32962.1 3-deoxy-D-manno-octulosonic-acid transferase [Puniceibacterium sediminis]